MMTLITEAMVEKVREAVAGGGVWCSRRQARAVLEAILPDIVEVCAKVAESVEPDYDTGHSRSEIVEAIRALSPKPPAGEAPE